MDTEHARIDRLAPRRRPNGRSIMHQTWGKLLFMHWAIDEQLLRPLIPRRLTIDTYDGKAWIGVVPFTMWNVRPVYFPAIPFVSSSHELNVRTYVHLDGIPGVWFLTMDASNPLAVWGARYSFFLPYYRARMHLAEKAGVIRYRSKRLDSDAPPGTFAADWEIGEPRPLAPPGSLDFFLTERYCLFSERQHTLYMARIHHSPWPLQSARLLSHASDLLPGIGLPNPPEPPLLHYADRQQVEVWPLKDV